MTRAANLEDFHATDEGCQASQALAAAATQAHQQHVAPRLTEHTADAADMLHSKEEHGQVHGPLAHACTSFQTQSHHLPACHILGQGSGKILCMMYDS